MTSKKKLTITIIALLLVLIVAVMSIVLIMAALNATVKSGITIKYTAHNVDAEVTITYKITGQEKVSIYTDVEKTNNILEFDPTEKSGIEKSFQPTGEIKIGPTDTIYFEMAVTNRYATDVMYVDCSKMDEGVQAMYNIRYTSGASNTQLVDPETAIYKAEEEVEGFVPGSDLVYAVQPTKTIYFYARFRVDDDTKDSLYDADFPIILTSSYEI